jgi:hypothetical protein
MGLQYDIAISFAGEDRKHASLLAGKLQARGVKVFYDEFNKATLWGKNLYDELADIYANRAKFCLMIISSSYAAKRWTAHERKHAQQRALNEKSEYILPVRLDDTTIPGLPDTVSYIDLRQTSIEELVDVIAEKLGLGEETSGITGIALLDRLENDLPIEFNQTRTEVHNILGEPDISEKDFETFYTYGLVVDYVDDKVVGIDATSLQSGTTFFGQVFGIRIGDTVEKCIKAWGPIYSKEEWPFEYDVLQWQVNEYEMRLEVWKKEGLLPVFGPYKSGRVKDIRVSVKR